MVPSPYRNDYLWVTETEIRNDGFAEHKEGAQKSYRILSVLFNQLTSSKLSAIGSMRHFNDTKRESGKILLPTKGEIDTHGEIG